MSSTFSSLQKLEKCLHDYLDLNYVTGKLVRQKILTKQDEMDIRQGNTFAQKIRTFIRILGLCKTDPLSALINVLRNESQIHNANNHRILADLLENKQNQAKKCDSTTGTLECHHKRIDNVEKNLEELASNRVRLLEEKLAEKEKELDELKSLAEDLYEDLETTQNANELLGEELKNRDERICALEKEIEALKVERDQTQATLEKHACDIEELKKQQSDANEANLMMQKMLKTMIGLAEGMKKGHDDTKCSTKPPVNEDVSYTNN